MDETTPRSLDGERVDRVVAMVADRSRAEAARLIGDGRVRLDGDVVVDRSRRVGEGQRLEIDLPPREYVRLVADPEVEVPVVFADDSIVVVDKPAGLVVHPGAGNETGTLVQGLLARFPDMAGVGEQERPGIVHRLDRDTSGLLVVARTAAAYSSLVAQLSARTATRRYTALVWGVPEPASGAIDAPIGRSEQRRTKMAVSASGRDARTWYEVERAYVDPVHVALLDCRLETGRTHQIRVHVQAIGHPIVGDRRYGGWRQSLPLARPFLHARRLAFTHPSSGEPASFESPLPADLAAVLAGLR